MSTVVGRGRTRGRSMFVVTVRRMTADGCRANGELARRSPRRPQSSVPVGALGSSTRRAATTWSGLTQIPSTVSIQDVLSLCAHRSISVWALISPVPTWRLSPVVRRNSMSVSMRPSIRVCSYHRVPRSHPCLPPSYSKSRNRATTARRVGARSCSRARLESWRGLRALALPEDDRSRPVGRRVDAVDFEAAA